MCQMVMQINTKLIKLSGSLEIIAYLGYVKGYYLFKAKDTRTKQIINPIRIHNVINSRIENFEPCLLRYIDLWERPKYILPYDNGYAVPIYNADYVIGAGWNERRI